MPVLALAVGLLASVAVHAEPLKGKQLVSGYAHSCVLLTDGSVKCWGNSREGALGLGDTFDRGAVPFTMGDNLPRVRLGQGRTATALAAGNSHTCALLDNGQVRCWGRNGAGQLGLEDTNPRGVSPNTIGTGLKNVNLGNGAVAIAIAAGGSHTCAVLQDGTLKCWGYGQEGQLGYGDTQARGGNHGTMGAQLPAVNLGRYRTAVSVWAGENHTCALLDDKSVKCWGRNSEGQLGTEDTVNRGNSPLTSGLNLPPIGMGRDRLVRQISASSGRTCALLDKGDVKCWGENRNGMLGLGDTVNRGGAVGTMAEGLPPVSLSLQATSVSVGAAHSCAVLINGAVRCWGLNEQGQLGLGDRNSRGGAADQMGEFLPFVELGAALSAQQVSAGGQHTCVLTGEGRVKCWGLNNSGQLGSEDSKLRGADASEMGDNLPYVNLGTTEGGLRE